jgi:hypothetical protein
MDKDQYETDDKKDFISISPSAKALLLLKGLTDIPFARDTAELISFPKKYAPDFTNKDFAFWKRVVHFEQRYWSIDKALSFLPTNNFLELSSGFSFRGLDMSRTARYIILIAICPALLIKRKFC